MKEVFIHLNAEAPFKYLLQIRQSAYSIIVCNIFVALFFFLQKTGNPSAFFNFEGKIASNIKLLKAWKEIQKKYLCYLLLILLVYHLFDKRFCYRAYESLLKCLLISHYYCYFVVIIKNDRFLAKSSPRKKRSHSFPNFSIVLQSKLTQKFFWRLKPFLDSSVPVLKNFCLKFDLLIVAFPIFFVIKIQLFECSY